VVNPEGQFPSRYLNAGDARHRFGDRVDRMGAGLTRTDPLAEATVAAFGRLPPGRGRAMLEEILARGVDAVPEVPDAVRALFADLDRVPTWVDWSAIERGASIYLRHGLVGAGILSGFVLPSMYASPAGNKPLTFSTRFTEKAARRLAETAHFVVEAVRPDGLRRFSEGFRTAVKVRLMHAQIRRLLARSERWKWDQWGAPINQTDMLGTNLALSALFLDGAMRMGFLISAQERDDYVHLWRYVGYLLGIDETLLPEGYDEATTLGQLQLATQGPPDDDSRALVAALRDVPLRLPFGRAGVSRRAYDGMCRHLLGDALADALGYPPSSWGAAVPLLRGAIRSAELVRRTIPGTDGIVTRSTTRMYERSIVTELGARPDYAIPETLRRTAVLRRSLVMNSVRALGEE
jgi:hypothetical protein